MIPNSQVKFKTSILRSSLCDYSEAYILVGGTIRITGAGTDHAAKQVDERNKGVTLKNCAPLTDCMRETNNNQIDNVEYTDVVMPMYDLTEYSKNYSKTVGSLSQYYGDESNESFQFKVKITGNATDVDNKKKNGVKKFKITHTIFYVPVVTLSNQDDAKLLQQLKSNFTRAINWNKYQNKSINRRAKPISRFLN